MKYRFESCVLDDDSYELLVEGHPQKVEPQVFDILRYMVENKGRVISQDELIKIVWKGRVVSDATVNARISAARSAIGDDGKKQSMIKTISRRGFKFVVPVWSDADIEKESGSGAVPQTTAQPVTQGSNQRVSFCKSSDGARIAFATTGEGSPLVRVGHWLTHLEHDWHSPIWRPFLNRLGRQFTVTRYDQRGNGLSDWNVDSFTLDDFVHDLEAVVDGAGLDKFAIYATSQGVPTAIKYATIHRKRISHLVLHGGYVRGRLLRDTPEEKEQAEALLTLMRHGWGKIGSPFLKAFSSLYIPEGTKEQLDSLVDLQKMTTSPANAVKLRTAVDNFDVSDLLDKVDVPTLVIHAQNDGVHPLEQGRELAAGIPGAKFILLDSSNHAILEHEPAWSALHQEIRDFVLG